MASKIQLPYISRVPAESKEPGYSLGPFADQQTGGSREFLNRWISNLKDTNPNKFNYGNFDPTIDLTVAPGTTEIVPNTGKDPFSTSGSDYLNQFLQSYDQSKIVEDPVLPGRLTSLIQERAQNGFQNSKQFPGQDGTSIS
jgi:hypothetical protein